MINKQQLQSNKIQCLNYSMQLSLQSKTFFKKISVVILVIALLLTADFYYLQHTQSNDLLFSNKGYQIFNHSLVKKPHNKTQVQPLHTPFKWNLPKFLWLYQNIQKTPQFPTFKKLNQLNTIAFAKQNNYSVIKINQKNYPEHLSLGASQRIVQIVKVLEQRLSDSKFQSFHQQIKDNKEKILERLIGYSLLLQKGGIFMNDLATVVQSFDSWLQKLLDLRDINVGDKNNPDFKPKCFGFYNKDLSSLKSEVEVDREFEFQKKLVIFPSIEDDFIACEKESELMYKLIEAYTQILMIGRDSRIFTKLNTNEKLTGRANPSQIYRYGDSLAMHFILQQRQRFLSAQNKHRIYKKLAIDDFGFVTINANTALFKQQRILGNIQRSYNLVAKLPIKYLTNITGPLRFVVRVEPNAIRRFENHLKIPSTSQEFFMENSFFYTYFLKYWDQFINSQKSNQNLNVPQSDNANTVDKISQANDSISIQIHPEPLESQNITSKQWNIERNIWIIWDSGIKYNSHIVAELCFENLKKSAQNSGFKLNLVTKNNVEEYIDKQTRQKIKYALSRSQVDVNNQLISDLWRIALIYQHGGVYLDATTFTIQQNFDFITNIARLDSGLIWNRYGEVPNNLIFWNQRYNHPANWQIEKESGIKSQMDLSYESNFIAGVKGSELMKEWLEVMLQWIVSDYDKVDRDTIQAGVEKFRWTAPDSRYLTVMDSIKVVVGRRQRWIKETNNTQYKCAADYYKLWSMEGYMVGQQKFRGETNHENGDYRLSYMQKSCTNVYRHEYSLEHVESILGQVPFQTKFFGFDAKMANLLLETVSNDHYNIINFESFSKAIHPDSVLSKLLRANPQRTLQIIKHYSKIRTGKTKFRPTAKIGYSIA